MTVVEKKKKRDNDGQILKKKEVITGKYPHERLNEGAVSGQGGAAVPKRTWVEWPVVCWQRGNKIIKRMIHRLLRLVGSLLTHNKNGYERTFPD